MSRNRLPLDREDEFCGFENGIFELWRVENNGHITRFFYNRRPMFEVLRKLSESEIIEHINIHEQIYRNGFKKGVEQTQESIKSALGIVED